MKVRWSERAAAEFVETAAYVAREFGGQAAIKMRNGINEAVASISQFPNNGKTSFTDEETCTEFREFSCRLSSVVYSIYKDIHCQYLEQPSGWCQVVFGLERRSKGNVVVFIV